MVTYDLAYGIVLGIRAGEVILSRAPSLTIATSSIVIRQLPPTTFTGMCTKLAAFTLSSVACYHTSFYSTLQMATNSERTCAQSDMRRKRQRHRAIALTETRKAIEQPEAANQEVTLFVVLSLASDAVGGIQVPTTRHVLTAFTKFANDDNKTGRMHLEGFKTLLRIYHSILNVRPLKVSPRPPLLPLPWLWHFVDSYLSRPCRRRRGNRPKLRLIGRLCKIVSEFSFPLQPNQKDQQQDMVDRLVHLAPNFSAHSSMSGSFQLRRESMMCMSYSACVVKPVMVLPLTIDLLVVGSMMPG